MCLQNGSERKLQCTNKVRKSLFVTRLKLNSCLYLFQIKGNTLNHDMMIRQVDMLFPADMKAPVKAAIEHCRGVGKCPKQ